MDVGTEVWVRVQGEAAWEPGRITELGEKEIKVAVPAVATKASEEDDDVATPGGVAALGPDGAEELVVTVSAEKERQLGSGAPGSSTSDFQNVKLRNSALDEVIASSTGEEATSRGGVDDLTLLTHLHEPAILDVLHSRYRKNTIYTFTGPILLAVNPFQKLPHLYSKEVLEEHYSRGVAKSSGLLLEGRGGMKPLAPHVFSLADNAYRSMMAGELSASGASSGSSSGPANLKNQSLLVSGESGAGKTETTKILLSYLATVGRPKSSGSLFNNSNSGLAAAGGAAVGNGAGAVPAEGGQHHHHKGGSTIEARVLQSQPVLEALGNAKTLRNDNSSRFGKYISLLFNRKGELVGASIQVYLLEKVRIVSASAGERSYHCYYQMMAGGSIEDKKRWGMLEDAGAADGAGDESGAAGQSMGPADFHFTAMSGTYGLKESDDAEDYLAMRRAMDTMGIDKIDQTELFDCLAAILHLSNVTFKESSGKSTARASLKSMWQHSQQASAAGAGGAKGSSGGAKGDSGGGGNDASNKVIFCSEEEDALTHASVEKACSLLGITREKLQAALTSKEITVGGTERFLTFFSLAQTCSALEAVCKALYGKLFQWVVWAINRQIRAEQHNTSGSGSTAITTSASSSISNSNAVASFIGVLDIFGFEQFAVNSFEQLCINYCNEALQQNFNAFVFKLEQQEYEREAIDWSNISFPDNQDVLDLIEAKGGGNPAGGPKLGGAKPAAPSGTPAQQPGILALLDEQCLLSSGASDESFASKAAQNYKDHPRFVVTNKYKANAQFAIRHYAGEVVYSCATGFIDKNRDAIHREATDLMLGSDKKMVRTVFSSPASWDAGADERAKALAAAADAAASGSGRKKGDDEDEVDVAAVIAAAKGAISDGSAAPTLTQGTGAAALAKKMSRASMAPGQLQALNANSGVNAPAPAPVPVPAPAPAPIGKAGGGGTVKGGLMSETVGTQFKSQLASLMTVIRSTQPHYIRCLKPNSLNVPRRMERAKVVEQLRCGGVLEAVRVARLGYPVRISHQAFLSTYAVIAPTSGNGSASGSPSGGGNTVMAKVRAILDGEGDVGKAGVGKDDDAASVGSGTPTPSPTVATGKAGRTRRAAQFMLQAIVSNATSSRDATSAGISPATPFPPIPEGSIQVGNTKVFFRRAAFDALEARRSAALRESAIKIQAIAKGWLSRKRYSRMRWVVQKLQNLARGHAARKLADSIRRTNAATVIQAFARGTVIHRRRYQSYRKAIITLQARKRGADARKLYLSMCKHRGASLLQSTWRMSRQRETYTKLRSATVSLQCKVRVIRARRLLLRYRQEAKEVGNLKQNNEALKSQNAALLQEMEALKQKLLLQQQQQQEAAVAAAAAATAEAGPSVSAVADEGPVEAAASAAKVREDQDRELSLLRAVLSRLTKGRIANAQQAADDDLVALVERELSTASAAATASPAPEGATPSKQPQQQQEVGGLKAKLAEQERRAEAFLVEIGALKQANVELQALVTRQTIQLQQAQQSGAASATSGAAASSVGVAGPVPPAEGDADSGTPSKVAPVATGAASGDGASSASAATAASDAAAAAVSAELLNFGARRAAKAETDAAVLRKEKEVWERRAKVAEKSATDAATAKLQAEAKAVTLAKEVAQLKQAIEAAATHKAALPSTTGGAAPPSAAAAAAPASAATSSAAAAAVKRSEVLAGQLRDSEAERTKAQRSLEQAAKDVKAGQDQIKVLNRRVLELGDEVEALREWKSLNLGTLTGLGRRLESVTLERNEAIGELNLYKSEVERIKDERDNYRQKVKELSLALTEATVMISSSAASGSGGPRSGSFSGGASSAPGGGTGAAASGASNPGGPRRGSGLLSALAGAAPAGSTSGGNGSATGSQASSAGPTSAAPPPPAPLPPLTAPPVAPARAAQASTSAAGIAGAASGLLGSLFGSSSGQKK